jgi:hypothetical protein
MTRIVATPAALDGTKWTDDALALRIAPDELLLTNTTGREIKNADRHAIVTNDNGFCGAWVRAGEALEFLQQTCEWELPHERPAFAQGAVAGLPVKLWLENERVLFLVPAAYAADLEERMA